MNLQNVAVLQILRQHSHVQVKHGASATAALDKIDIAAWSHTAMVGGTVCNIESLDPIEAPWFPNSTHRCLTFKANLPDGGAENVDLF